MQTPPPIPRDRWAIPRKIGYVSAVQYAHFVAAPLLAAAAISLSGIMAADADKFRWPGPAILVLTVCTILLISCIQNSFNGASYLLIPADLDAWYGNTQRPSVAKLMQMQQQSMRRWRRSVVKAVNLYNLGVTTLALGATISLSPPEHSSVEHAVCRWSACALVGISTIYASVATASIWLETRSD
jgi:hypothetical protein